VTAPVVLAGSEALRERWQGALMDNYGTPALALVRGRGARVWDADGTEYIDLLAGIAVNALGHADPRLVAAVTAQLSTLGHTSNLQATEPAIALAERLQALVGDPSSRVFFCNSGAEANEAAFKLARLTGRPRMVVAQSSFHGRTMGALALTAQPAKQDPFRPLPGDVTVVPYGDAEALAAAVDDAVAAIILEPIQGEGGVIVPPDGYLAQARRIADDHGALLILDEVQTGVGRTGAWFAHQHEAVVPDIMTLAKGLGGGLPIGAVIAFGRAAAMFGPGSHGSTFGGNTVSCAAALAVLDAIDEDGLIERARVLHDVLATGLVDRGHGLVIRVRGRGLLMAAVIDAPPAADLERACRTHGLLVNAVAPDAIRLAPPLVLTDADVAEALDRWDAACASVVKARSES
jgi:acetylornithine/N-succinyldiaminopimelate aminotransferase